jgi:hypothetical protein
MLKSIVRWNSVSSQSFYITQGVRQGSILSPHLFNIFIDGMLQNISNCDKGVNIGDTNYNCFAYADDVNLFAATVPGLQHLINICHDYAHTWNFNFGIKKSKCMTIGPNVFSAFPSWFLGSIPMNNSDQLEILGVTFSPDCRSTLHTNKRIKSARASLFGLSPVGMAFPGLDTDVKLHLWKSTCLPALVYGCDGMNMDNHNLKSLNSVQGSSLKGVLGLGKRSHHSNLLKALKLKNVDEVIKDQTLSFYHRIFKIESPLQKLCSHLIYEYIVNGMLYKGTIVENVVRMGQSPVNAAFKKTKPTCCATYDGVVDSLQYLIHHENFIKPGSNEHILTRLLTRSF